MGGKRLSRFSPAFSAACASRPPQGRREQEGQQTPGRGGVVAELADQEFHPPGKLIHRWGLAGELTALHDLGDFEQMRRHRIRKTWAHGLGRFDGGTKQELPTEIPVGSPQFTPRSGGSSHRGLPDTQAPSA